MSKGVQFRKRRRNEFSYYFGHAFYSAESLSCLMIAVCRQEENHLGQLVQTTHRPKKHNLFYLICFSKLLTAFGRSYKQHLQQTYSTILIVTLQYCILGKSQFWAPAGLDRMWLSINGTLCAYAYHIIISFHLPLQSDWQGFTFRFPQPLDANRAQKYSAVSS